MALLVGAWLWAGANNLQSGIEQQTSGKAAQYRYEASIRARSRCALVAPADIPNCVYQEHDAARQREHDEYDLQAQLVTSVWTQAMGIAAVVGMMVGVFGVGLLYKTFEANRHAADAAQDANRPWVDISIQAANVLYVSQDGIKFDLAVTLKNVGNSPAISIMTVAQLAVDAQPDQIDVRKAERKVAGSLNAWDATNSAMGITLFPNSHQTQNYTVTLSPQEIAAEIADVTQLAVVLLAVGTRYRYGGKRGRTVASHTLVPRGNHLGIDPVAHGDVRLMRLDDNFTGYAV